MVKPLPVKQRIKIMHAYARAHATKEAFESMYADGSLPTDTGTQPLGSKSNLTGSSPSPLAQLKTLVKR